MAKAAAMGGVSIITCTNRSQFFDNILENFKRQQYRKKELIIILNRDGMNLQTYRRKTRGCQNVSVYKVPERVSLGQCLNCGIAKTRYSHIAKFDDDDYYSPFYLKEQMNALERTKNDVVGKHACLVYLTATKRLIVRSPEEQHKQVNFVQGGTILFKRRVLDNVRFADRSLGEDVTFLRTCRKKGYRTYATSPFNYVYIRRADKKSHTWKAGDEFYLKGSRFVGVTENYRRVAFRKR